MFWVALGYINLGLTLVNEIIKHKISNNLVFCILHKFIGQSQPQVDPNSIQNIAQSSYLEEYVLKPQKLFENGSVQWGFNI